MSPQPNPGMMPINSHAGMISPQNGNMPIHQHQHPLQQIPPNILHQHHLQQLHQQQQRVPHHIMHNPQPGGPMMNGHGLNQMPPGVMMPHPHHLNHPQQQAILNGKSFPIQPNIFDPRNPHAPSIHPCRVCQAEVQGEADEALKCESGCNFWFHRACIQMSPEAYHFLKNEIYAEWACEDCIRHRRIQPVKIKI